MIKINSESRQQTEKTGYNLGAAIPYGKVVALFGDLGAGKTAFTSGFVKGMGLNAFVTSPTFALVNDYSEGDKKVYHFDMYRISGWDDLYSTGYFDYLDEGATLIIEWSENIESVLPEDCIRVIINKTDDENQRSIEIIGCDNIEITCG